MTGGIHNSVQTNGLSRVFTGSAMDRLLRMFGFAAPAGPSEASPSAPAAERPPAIDPEVFSFDLGGAILVIKEEPAPSRAAVESFRSDHKALLAAFRAAQDAGRKGRWAEAKTNASAFNVALQRHAIKKTARLYEPLKARFHGDKEALAVFEKCRRELGQAARLASDFAQRHKAVEFDPEPRRTFLDELDEIGARLAACCARDEEYLFPFFELD